MRIRAVAHAVPSRLLTNADLIELVRAGNPSPELGSALLELLERAGAQTRRHRAPQETALPFGVAAGRRALEKADLSPRDIDLLIYVGVGRGFLEPATANVFQHALGLSNATCFDLLDACASWLRGVDVAHHLLQDGQYRNAMILNCEFNFREYAPLPLEGVHALRDVGAAFTVGEAATATVLERRSGNAEYHATFRTSGEYHALSQIPLPHADQFRQRGCHEHPALKFYAHARPLNAAAIDLLARHYWSDDRISGRKHDITFGHSAGLPATEKVAHKLELPLESHYEIFPRYGNTVSASLPLAMSLAHDEGRLERGQRVLLIMGSAGLTSGFCSFVF